MAFKPCKAKSKRTGEQCKARAAYGKEVCYHHGALAGAPKGNSNPRTHGLFSKKAFISDEGDTAYSEALETDLQVLARKTAAFIVAKAHEAFAEPIIKGAAGRICEEALKKAVERQEILPEQAHAALQALSQPTLQSMAKAFSPLKGLLEVAGDGGEASQVLRGIIMSAAKSNDWAKEGDGG